MTLSSIVMPVVEVMDGERPEFRAVMKQVWLATTRCSNWMMTELYARDCHTAGVGHLPPMPAVALYAEARERFPELPSKAVAALERMSYAKYRAKRSAVLCTHESSLPTFRFPTPLSLPRGAWTVRLDAERPVLGVFINDRRWSLRLKSGPRFRRQLTAVRQIVSGSAVAASCDLYERGIGGIPTVMSRMAVWLPRTAERNPGPAATLTIRSSPNALVTAETEDDGVVWTYHADQVRRWTAEHREQMSRWQMDARLERSHALSQRRSLAAERYRNRMSTLVRQVAAAVARFAALREFTVVRYDDSDRSFCPAMPWFALREQIRSKLAEMRIQFETESREGNEGLVELSMIG